MGLTIAIGAVFFAGMLAVLWFGYHEVEKDRAEKAAAATAAGGGASGDRTADELVFDIEHRIEGDLREVGDLLRQAGPAGAARLYRA